MQETVKALNFLYRKEPALYHFNFSYEGFEWLDADNTNESVYVFMRKGPKAKDTLVIAINLTPVVREDYRIGVPFKNKWKEIFNTDDIVYYGSGINNRGDIIPNKDGYNNQDYSINITLPPLAVTIFKSK